MEENTKVPFLDLLDSLGRETTDGHEAMDRLFGGEAKEGFSKPWQRRGIRSPQAQKKYMRGLTEAAKFTAEIVQSQAPMRWFSEAMSRSDFPLLFGDIMDRQFLARYQAWPTNWESIAKRNVAPDFRTLQRFYWDGGDEAQSEVKELTEYPETSIVEGKYQLGIKKYGKRLGFSWETFVNDDVGFVTEAPEALARGARRTEMRFVSDLYVGPNGPDATLYSGPNANIVASNPVLTPTSLNAAISMMKIRTYRGEPIFVSAVTLRVPPQLEFNARLILDAPEIELSASPWSSTMIGRMPNPFRNIVKLEVDPYIPILATSANGTTSWFVFADPNNGRPALEVDFLRGHEVPELFQKAPNALRLGGGLADPMDGSYENDSIEWKCRSVIGGGIIDAGMTVASNGSGS